MKKIELKTKLCRDCDKKKSKLKFSSRTCKGKVFLFSYCKPCMVLRTNEWTEKNRSKHNAYQLKYHHKYYVKK